MPHSTGSILFRSRRCSIIRFSDSGLMDWKPIDTSSLPFCGVPSRRETLADWLETAREARQHAEADHHIHQSIRRLTSEDWTKVEALAEALAAALSPLAELASRDEMRSFEAHVNGLLSALERVSSGNSMHYGTIARAGRSRNCSQAFCVTAICIRPQALPKPC